MGGDFVRYIEAQDDNEMRFAKQLAHERALREIVKVEEEAEHPPPGELVAGIGAGEARRMAQIARDALNESEVK